MRINFELLDIRAFLAVLDLGSFSKAADALNLSQPALSRRIQSLEAAIGAPLFERTTRHVAPTAVGRSLAPMSRRLLDEFEESLLGTTGIAARQAGQITLACVPTAVFYFLPRAIEQFNARFPHIRFRILDLPANEGLASVANGEAEFGINLTGSTDPDLGFTPLLDDPFVLACRRDHALAHPSTVGREERRCGKGCGRSGAGPHRGAIGQAGNRPEGARRRARPHVRGIFGPHRRNRQRHREAR